ncbi:MAG: threonine synthase [Candidatus Diapherotrites archaeon]|nr:threonine synthase [Candidatus Diapherotrites archaeon]
MSENMKYYSTNGVSQKSSFREVLLQGIAEDKGLFMPEVIPRLSQKEIFGFKEKKYPEIAFTIFSKFIGKEIPEKDLRKIVEDTYNFSVPIEKVRGVGSGTYVLRLDGGPTASFKDFAARTMARLMDYFMRSDEKKLTILVATSGDTGSAVANAFYGLENIEVIVLFPEKEVTSNQRRQMTTLGKNISVLAVKGKFDDCQAMVKRAFADSDLCEYNFSSANSINLGRLIPQSVYYFYSYSRVADSFWEKIIFSVPCGNFGNLCGGLIAQRMGLPVKKFVAAVNENDEFPIFLETGRYKKIVPSKKCVSNAMNVGHPSNLSRLIDFYNGQMDENGKIIKLPDLEKMRGEIFSVAVSDNETKKTIIDAYNKHMLLLEPHGAVAWKGLEVFLEKSGGKVEEKLVSLETAHPSKFPEEIEALLNIKPALHPCLKGVAEKKENFEIIENDYISFKNLLKGRKE